MRRGTTPDTSVVLGDMSSAAAAAHHTPSGNNPRLHSPENLPRPSQSHSSESVSWLPYREVVLRFYQTQTVQFFVAAVILINFFAIVIEKEIDPYESDYQRFFSTWQAIDDVCNIIFLVELLVNMYGSWWRPFVSNPWNALDVVVVVVGVLSLARVPLGPAAKVKILRAFRVLRLFKRVKSLNKILVALLRSIPGVLNAFVVMLIFMCIFAILAVDYFRSFGGDGTYTTVQTYGAADAQWGQGADMSFDKPPYLTVENTTVVSAMTMRGFHYGQEYFGTFFRSLYTLFQVLTGESWSEAVVRPLLFGVDPSNAFGTGFFFTIYILLTQVVLQNVVVAVLLDKFTQSDDEEEEESAAADLVSAVAPGSDAADAAILAKAAALGGGPPAMAGTPAAAPGDALSLRADFDRIMQQQSVIKAQLHIILERLNANDAAMKPPLSPSSIAMSA